MFTYIATYAFIQLCSIILSVFGNVKIEHFKPNFISIFISGLLATVLWTYLTEYYYLLPPITFFNFLITE